MTIGLPSGGCDPGPTRTGPYETAGRCAEARGSPRLWGVQTLAATRATRTVDRPHPRTARPRWTSVLVPVVVGLALGPLDLLLQHLLPYPFANLANSPAAWALVAFGVGWSDRIRGRVWPAAAGTLTLLLAVEGYYATAVLTLGDDPSTLTNRAALLWLVLAAVTGVVFGTAGAWARSGHPWRGPLGTAVPVGVLLTEAWLDLARLADAANDAARRQDLVQTALVLLVLAALTAVLAGRSARQRVLGAVVALPTAMAGALLFGPLGLL